MRLSSRRPCCTLVPFLLFVPLGLCIHVRLDRPILLFLFLLSCYPVTQLYFIPSHNHNRIFYLLCIILFFLPPFPSSPFSLSSPRVSYPFPINALLEMVHDWQAYISVLFLSVIPPPQSGMTVALYLGPTHFFIYFP